MPTQHPSSPLVPSLLLRVAALILVAALGGQQRVAAAEGAPTADVAPDPPTGEASAPENPYGDSPIEDNSFLIEEAYNQEPGVIQHINTYSREAEGGGWTYSFTEEWPVASQRHQLSLTVSALGIDGGGGAARGVGDAALNYRYQLAAESRVWVSPRVSLLVPSGNADRGLGAGGWGLQFNMPVSVRVARRLVSHTNAGFTLVRNAAGAGSARADTSAAHLGEGLVYLVGDRFNLMLESVWSRYEAVAPGGGTVRRHAAFVSPGLRFAINLPSGLQVVPGIAFPIGVGPSDGERSLFLYLSLEHAFETLGR